MQIKVLGTGCKNCKQLLENTKKACSELSSDAEILYITDYLEIAKTGLMRTPGLMIDDKIVSFGKVPTSDEIIKLINNAL
ncbi:MAG: thioredoxin family protein [Acholeplasmataceae bacterium]